MQCSSFPVTDIKYVLRLQSWKMSQWNGESDRNKDEKGTLTVVIETNDDNDNINLVVFCRGPSVDRHWRR